MAPAWTRPLIFGGATGLLGQSLTRALRATGAEPIPLSSRDCDLLDQDQVRRLLDRTRPDLIFTAAAYTKVDLAEAEPQRAMALNAEAPPQLAAAAAERSLPFVHFSTDFVFAGDKTTPYAVEDPTGPLSVYGRSKALGEANLLRLGLPHTLIVRTSWLFGPGRSNFVEKILTLCRERERLRVVADQTGSPSYAPDVAANTLLLLQRGAVGVYHLANAGQTTWHGLAQAAVDLAGLPCVVEPIPSSAYPTAAARPAYSVLDLRRFTQTTKTTPRPWPEALRDYVLRDLPRELRGNGR